MPKIELTLEIVQDLDIKSGRLVGIVTDPFYEEVKDAYGLDIAQCFLWLDLVRLLSYIMEECDYEDSLLDFSEAGAIARKVLQPREKLFPFFGEFVIADSLSEDEAFGKTIYEMILDITQIYDELQKELAEIFQTQEEIGKWIGQVL